MISGILGFFAGFVSGVGFMILTPILLVMALILADPFYRDEVSSRGSAFIMFLLIALMCHFRFHPPAKVYLYSAIPYLLFGISYSLIGWYRGCSSLRSRIEEWFSEHPGPKEHYTVFMFLEKEVRIVWKEDLNKTLLSTSENLKPTQHMSAFYYWILCWPLCMLNELTQNLFKNILNILSGLYQKLTKKAMGVG